MGDMRIVTLLATFIHPVCMYTMLTLAAVSDAKRRIIPNKAVLMGVAGWALCAVLAWSAPFIASGIQSALAAAAIPLALELWARRVRGTTLIGGGDVKLIAAASLYLPWRASLAALLGACAIGAAMGIVMRKCSRYHPFGIAIAASFAIAYAARGGQALA